MKCPHCNNSFFDNWKYTSSIETTFEPSCSFGVEIKYSQCPECRNLIVYLIWGPIEAQEDFSFGISNCEKSELVYPTSTIRFLEPEIPDIYAIEFREACSILNLSPKASAALSRRILQNILRNEFSIKKQSLEKEIEEFISHNGIPSHLSQAIDAVRNIGNFAAHPTKDKNTGEIVDVEPGEAEWLLEVLESLFDFTFVQPKRLEERKKKLNVKLQSIGKPPMK